MQWLKAEFIRMTLAYVRANDTHLKKKTLKPISWDYYSYCDVIVHIYTAWNGLTRYMEYVTLTFAKKVKTP